MNTIKFVFPSSLFQDLRFGVRMLRRNPGLTLLIIGTLAVGIGASSTLFSIFRMVHGKALPYPEPDRLVALWDSAPQAGLDRLCVTYLNFMDWKTQNSVFDKMAAFQVSDFNFRRQGEPEPERVTVSMVTSDYFTLLGASPELGKPFTESEFQPGNRSVILSHGFWQSHFGGRADVVGQTVILDSQSFMIVGVMPAKFILAFRFALDQINRNPDMWTPLFSGLAQVDGTANRYNHVLGAIARLKAGTTLAQAQGNMDVLAQQLAREYPQENSGLDHVRVMALQESMYGNLHPVLWSCLAVVASVMMLIGFNVVHLQLSRGIDREKEMAIRTSLGASQGRLIRQLLMESLLLALVSCGLGLWISDWGCHLVNRFLANTSSPIPALSVDGVVLVGMLLLGSLIGLFFGLAPAFYLSRTGLNCALNENGRQATRGMTSSRMSRWLVMAELSVSMAIMVSAGLLLKSFAHLWQQDPGFRVQDTLSMKIPLSVRQYPDGNARIGFYQRLLEQCTALPGVAAAGLTSHLPLLGANLSSAFLEGYETENKSVGTPFNVLFVSSRYHEAMGVPLRGGRLFTEQDSSEALPVAIISESAARQFWAGQDPVGKRIRRGSWEPWRTIVGVVGDVKQDGLAGPTLPAFYIPFRQVPHSSMTLVMHTKTSPLNLVPAIRTVIRALDPNQPITQVQTMQQALQHNVAERRFLMGLVGCFAAGGTLIALGGIYGVLAFSVHQRTREFGIRLALGARPRDVLAMVLRQGLGMILIGSLIGLALASASTRLLSGFLYGVTVTDPVVFLGVALLLDAVALWACYVPARRALHIDPVIALRCE